jgi:regulatory GntR family protein
VPALPNSAVSALLSIGRGRTRCIALCRVLPVCAAYGRNTVMIMTRVPAFDPAAGPPGYLWRKVADHIAARIAAGELQPGARLPGERDLAAEYGVSLGTARRAVASLRERGLVETLAALGTFVIGQ